MLESNRREFVIPPPTTTLQLNHPGKWRRREASLDIPEHLWDTGADAFTPDMTMTTTASPLRPAKLCIVMPCFNEEACLAETVVQVEAKLVECEQLGLICEGSFMLFSDDGSRDGTWNELARLHEATPRVHAVRLAANRGKEYALYAGLMEARPLADIVICMDADLQHDINAINDFLKLYHEGYDLIYGVKTNRGREPFYKKLCAASFYGLMNRLGSPIIKDHTDYSLMTRQVLDALSEYGETNMMFRGILRSLGFRQCPCPFEVKERTAGESKFSARKLLNLSIDAITSFSVAPLRLIGVLGFCIFLTSLLMIAWFIADWFTHRAPAGWATITCSLWFLGGLGMISMAILGEYLGKMYMETKKRPRYFLSQRLH